MTEKLSRITLRNCDVMQSQDGKTTVVGYVLDFEPEAHAKRDILRPVEPDEPDTEIEVGYSKNALEPLTIEFQGRKIELTLSTYRLFRYINDLYLTEEETKFEFAELSEILTGDELGKGKVALVRLIRRLAESLEKISAPISLTYRMERLYVVTKVGHQK